MKKGTEKGYTFLWRKQFDNPFLMPKGHVFTRFEAWTDICNRLARGTDGDGLKRGEFKASARFLAKRWNWGRSTAADFLKELEKLNMIERSGRLPGHLPGHFSVCNYETYNPTSGRKSGRLPGQIKEGERRIKESPDGDLSSTHPRLLLDRYNRYNQVLPAVRAFSPDRQSKCRSRINRALQKGRLEPYLKDFEEAVKKAQRVPFLRGEGRLGWRASFDWFIANDRNVYKVLEGHYDRLNPERTGGGTRAGEPRYTPKQ